MKRIIFSMLCLGLSQLLIANGATVNGIQLPVLANVLRALPDGTEIRPQVQLAEETIVIPVVVHVMYNATQENITDEQIYSQIRALNKDYRGRNADRSKVPAYFAPYASDCGIEFRLATIDPDGLPTTGIIRKRTSIKVFGADDRIKNGAAGGDNPWERKHYLNIWVGNLAGGMLGYSSIPGAQADKDGVVIKYTAFGTTGTAAAPFNLGRTATHEIGHWLNLRHLWGDTYCGDDEVDDTPTQRTANKGTPAGELFTCGTTGHGDMYMNFMDLTDDAAMFMFTEGQKRRMRALFQNYGFRHEIISSGASVGTGFPLLFALPAQQTETADVYAVYPNPAVSEVVVENKSGTARINQSVVILNSAGQPVITQMMTGSRIAININHLKPGFYFIKAGGEGFATMLKFVKQ